MRTKTTVITLYICSFLTLAAFLMLTCFYYPLINWNDFFAAASLFLPVATGLLVSALLLFLGIYLAIKAINHRKEKKHVRYF